MTEPRHKISLFRKPKPIEPRATVARVIPIRVVSRAAIERLVESFNRSASNAE